MNLFVILDCPWTWHGLPFTISVSDHVIFLLDYNTYLSKHLCPPLPYLPYKRALIQTTPTQRTPEDIQKDTTENLKHTGMEHMGKWIEVGRGGAEEVFYC